MATVASSVNYTEESRRFQEALLNGEPGTENGGLYANKAGYHNKRQNLPMPGSTSDYSITAPVDQRGPSDKSAAHDWSFPEAWGSGGDHRRIGLYMSRVRDAFNRRDPRLKGWREVLGCLDSNPDRLIGFDFDNWITRTPDSSHWGHIHFSEHREFVSSWDNKVKMLEVLGLRQSGGMLMLCQYGDKDGVTGPVGALQAVLHRLGYNLGSSGVDGAYGDRTRDSLQAALATVGWNVDGTKYWAGEWAALQQVVINAYGVPGPKGDPGEPGEKGDPGEPGAPGEAAELTEGSILTVTKMS